MSDLGLIALSLALAATTYSIFGLVLSIRKSDNRLLSSSRKASHVVTALLSLSVISLTCSLLARDFQVEYVASYTSSDLPLPYTVSALWAGQGGSLLFWAWLLSLYGSVLLLRTRHRSDRLLSYTSLVMVVTEAFFLVMLVFVSNPFHKLDFIPADGLGMNPLLQNVAMLWHPPIVYLGYVGFTVPFALTMGALISGRLREPYVLVVRRWILIPWLCLGLGTLLGAQWAYVELGWGGYWGWDPVENASLLPWLTATALLHSLMFRGGRQAMKVGHAGLMVTTFALCIFGTLVTRSGIISSVHAFAVSGIGLYFLAFLAFIIVGSIALIVRRLPELKGETQWGSPISRHSCLLLCIVLLVAATAAIFLGTTFPLVSDLLNLALTRAYFDSSSAMILGPLIVLMGICPFTSWRGNTFEGLGRQLLPPFICGLVVGASLLGVGLRDPFAILAFSICAFVMMGTLIQFYQGVRRRRRLSRGNYLSAFGSAIWRRRRTYGGYLVHLAIGLVAIGVIGSSAYKSERQLTMERGTVQTVGDYSLQYDGFAYYPAPGKDVAAATLSIFQGDRQVGVLVPQEHFHHSTQQPVSEVAIRTTLLEDLYVALIGWEEAGQTILLHVVVSPLVVWIWIGGAVLFLGALIAIWPDFRRDALDQRIEREIKRLRESAEEEEPSR